MKKILALAVAIVGGYTVASAAAPALTLRPVVQGDSVRVVATWRTPCDLLGCADSVSVSWSAGGSALRTRTTRETTDTLWLPAPRWGDSVRVGVSVTAIRRNLLGTTRTSATVVRRLDAPPPPVDSLRVDTVALRLQLQELAQLDSYPVIVPRDTFGNAAGTLALGDSMPLCALARNRYTGAVTIMVPGDAPAWADTLLARTCERARVAYESERSG